MLVQNDFEHGLVTNSTTLGFFLEGQKGDSLNCAIFHWEVLRKSVKEATVLGWQSPSPARYTISLVGVYRA